MTAPPPDDANLPLTPAQKAVAVVSAMGRPVAAQLVKHFREEDRETMLRAASGLPSVPPAMLDKVIEDFERAFVAGAGATDNLANIEAVLERRLEALRAGGGKSETDDIWKTIAEIEPPKLVERLEDEAEWLLGLVLLRLPSAPAAALIEALPIERRGRAVALASGATLPPPEIMAEIEAHLRRLAMEDDGDGVEHLTAIFNELERDVVEAILNGDDMSPDAARAVRAGLFMFEDIAKLSDADRTSVLDDVPGEELAEALSGLDKELAETMLGAISQRARRMIEAQMAGPAPPQSKTRAARKSIAARALVLAKDERIALPKPNEAA